MISAAEHPRFLKMTPKVIFTEPCNDTLREQESLKSVSVLPMSLGMQHPKGAVFVDRRLREHPHLLRHLGVSQNWM